MGLEENGTQEPESNEIEKLKTTEILSQSFTTDDYKLDSEIVVTEPVEQKKISGAQNSENNAVFTKENSAGIKEIEPSPGGIFQNVCAGKQEPLLENVNVLVVPKNLELASQGRLANLANSGIPTGIASVNPGCENLEPEQKDATKTPGHLENDVKGTNAQPRNRKGELRAPVTGSWALRSKSQEKSKAPEPDYTNKEGSANKEKKRARKKRQKKKSSVSEFSRTKTHLRYLLHRIKYEQSLIDAYSAEGWKGQSLEKLKPEKELQRAKSHILRYKLKIRELFQRLDLSLAVGKIPESLFDSVGEIDSEDIFCAKCGSKDLSLDNDIILCDGSCERGFHQFCLEPPLLKADIPPGDEGWLCPGCDCKVDCIDMLKDFQGTNLSIFDGWEKIFPEAASAAAGKTLDDGSGSDDSEDDDYDPDKPETIKKVQGDESSSDESNYFSASDDLAASPNNEKYLGLPSDDSADDDFDPSALDLDKQVEQSSSSSDFTSDSEDLDALLDDAVMPGSDPGHISLSSDCKCPSMGSNEGNPKVGGMKGQSLKDELAYLMETSGEPVSGKRHVERLDYQKLLEETYGNSSSDSSDEDFDDATAPKRRKISHEKTVMSLNKTTITKSKIDAKDENQKESKLKPKGTQRNPVDGGTKDSSAEAVSASMGIKNRVDTDSSAEAVSASMGIKNPVVGGTNDSSAEAVSASTSIKRSASKRLGEAVTQRLYESFYKNQYPERAVKENLAKELGLTIQQVTKWFENARWSFYHRSRMEQNITEKPSEPQATIIMENTPSNQAMKLCESNAIPADDHIPGMIVENLMMDTSAGNSGAWKSRKRKGKIDQATYDISVINNTVEQNMQVDSQSPQLGRSGKRQTRSSKTIS